MQRRAHFIKNALFLILILENYFNSLFQESSEPVPKKVLYILRSDHQPILSFKSISSPRFIVEDKIDYDGVTYLYLNIRTEENIVSYLKLKKPIPQKLQMVDFHILNGRQVYSKKIYDILHQQSIKGLQFVPAVIRGKMGIEYTDYWIANIYQEHEFPDKEKSKYQSLSPFGKWNLISKMVLDKKKVQECPLEERLIFILKESNAYVLYHRTIVDIILSVNPVGLNFIPVDKWKKKYKY